MNNSPIVLYQDYILDLINKSSIDTLPKSLILLGEYGSGKHLISEYISSKFNLISVDITEKLNYETIEEINSRVEPYLYIINGSEISIKEQNVILKFLEEPLKNSFIIILCENKNQLLNTVLNRCQIWELKKYTNNELHYFMFDDLNNRDLLLKVARTPGQIKEISADSLGEMFELSYKILDKIGNATLPNTLSLADKLAFKNEKDKLNVYVFIKVLNECILDRILNSDNDRLFEVYSLTKEFVNNQYIPNINKRYLFENYLIKLRNIMRGEN